MAESYCPEPHKHERIQSIKRMDNSMSDFHSRLTQLRRELHQHPELGFEEHRTKSTVIKRLTQLGVEVHEGAGVVGVLKRGNGNRCIGLRADMDALPIQETSTHTYPSKTPGIMHACGHDGHTTMLLGAAELLCAEPDFDGTVVFIFQPNEEHGLGAKAMIDEGVLEQFPMQEVYAIHNLPGAPVGQLSSKPGQICASESLFEITIRGQGGHASMPHVGVDAITVGAELVSTLQTIVSRKLAPGAGAVVSVTEFITDGQRNVLPGTATLKGDVRARLPQDRQKIHSLMQQIVDGLASTHQVEIELAFNTEFIETINADVPTQAAMETGQHMQLDVIGNREAMSFSEDFAHFCAAVPGCFMLLGNGETGPHAQPLHASDYDFNDEILSIGANYWANLVYSRLPRMQQSQ